MNIRPARRRAGHLVNPEVLEAFEFAAQAETPTRSALSGGLEALPRLVQEQKSLPAAGEPRRSRPLPSVPRKLGLEISTVHRRVSAIPRHMLALAILRRPANGLCEKV